MWKFCYYLGGYDGKKVRKTSEFIHPNGSKTQDPIELPEPRDAHCMVEYAGIIILMGGRYASHLLKKDAPIILSNLFLGCPYSVKLAK